MSDKKRKGLGKGLSALMGSGDKEVVKAVAEAEKTGVQEIELSIIDVNPNQPRKIFNETEIDGLAKSIEENGLINPLTLRKKNDRYQIISGERRFRAMKLLGRKKAAALVLDVPDVKMLEITLVENIQREDLNSIEIARSYKQLINDLSIRQEDLAKRVGKSRSAISNAMRILDLNDNIINMIIEGKLTEGHARTILSIEGDSKREKFAHEIVEKGYSVRECENIVKAKKEGLNTQTNKTTDSEKTENKKDPNIRRVESDLEKIFATKVNVLDKGNNEGKIVIEYYSSDDFSRIMEILENVSESNNKNKSATTEIKY